jgi:hypothetical protein
VIQLAQNDGSDVPWTGTVPIGKCLWLGTNPGNAAAAVWKPFLLSSPSEFRPPAPAPCDSEQIMAETQTVRDFPRSPAAFATNYHAFYWQSPEGIKYWPYVYGDKWMFEDGLVQNPPTRGTSLCANCISFFDSFIASQDGKFTYWYIRPDQHIGLSLSATRRRDHRRGARGQQFSYSGRHPFPSRHRRRL